MKVLVAVKRVVDFTVRIRIKGDGSGIDMTNVKMAMNPFDEIAIEEAIRLKEKNLAQEVVVVSIGKTICQETIRTGLAMGADRGILVETDQELNPLTIAKILKVICERESSELVILGKQAIDDDSNQTGQMLAGLLNWSQGTFVSQLSLENGQVKVIREVDGGLETLLLKLPTVITTDLRLNEPRYLSLPNIVQAKRKPITILPLQELNLDITSKQQILQTTEPKKHRAGVRVNSVTELVEKLRSEAQVIA